MSNGAPVGDGATTPAGSFPLEFSAGEMERRRAALAACMERAGVERVVLYGSDKSGNAVQWLTQWPVTREAAVVWAPGEEALLLVQYANHVPNAGRLARGSEVRWGGLSTVETLAQSLAGLGAARARVGVVGPLPARAQARLAAAVGELVRMDPAYQELRLVKSDEEMEWLRVGAGLTDLAVGRMAEEARVGLSEMELGALLEGAYLGLGGTNHIHYLGVTSMADPSVCVPAQWPSPRRLRPGDVLSCEVSASWWGYTGQLLRTFTVETGPNPLYRELHDVASAAFEAVSARVRAGVTGAELAEAARLIGEAGFGTCDDIVHGYGGGYLPPVVPGGNRPAADEGFVLEPGMTVVVQPNVVTLDARAGVQTGELLAVTETGSEPLHHFPRGLGRVAPA